MIPAAYRDLLGNTQAHRLLLGLGASALGDGMSMVSVAWLAVLAAPAGNPGVFVGLAVAAYTPPGAVGALALSRFLRRRAARALVVSDTWLRAGCLAAIALLWAAGGLAPFAYLGLLAGSSVLSAWGNAGQYTLLSELGGPDGRLAANSLYAAQMSLAVIAGQGCWWRRWAPDPCSAWTPPRPRSLASRHGGHGQVLPPPRIRSISAGRNRVSGCCAGSAWSASSR